MASLVHDPNVLTKEKLKATLQTYNIPMPPSDSKKDVYVELYRSKLLKDRAEFSSDDDDAVSSTPKSKKKAITKKPLSPKKKSPTKKMVKGGSQVDVYSLSDAELAKKLVELNVDVGPILDTTRKVYQKKLDRLLNQGPVEPVSPVRDEPDEREFSDDPEDDVPESTAAAELRRRPMSARPSTRSQRSQERGDEPDSPPAELNHLRSEPAPQATNSTGASQAKAAPKQSATTKRAMSVWIQVGIFLAVAAMLFLVIQNMEPGKKSNIGAIDG